MLRRSILFVIVGSMLSAVGLGIVSSSTPVQGSGETFAINAFQFQGPGEIRVGRESYSTVSTATILGILPGPGHTLMGTTSHLIDFGDGNTITTMDEALLVPVDSLGRYQLHIKATIVSGTGAYEGAQGSLTFAGRIDLGVGQAQWMVHGQLR